MKIIIGEIWSLTLRLRTRCSKQVFRDPNLGREALRRVSRNIDYNDDFTKVNELLQKFIGTKKCNTLCYNIVYKNTKSRGALRSNIRNEK